MSLVIILSQNEVDKQRCGLIIYHICGHLLIYRNQFVQGYFVTELAALFTQIQSVKDSIYKFKKLKKAHIEF